MRRTLKNAIVGVLVLCFTALTAWLLHGNPFGDSDINWPVAIGIALAVNCFLAYVLAAWAAPYLASTGGREGAESADPHSVAVAERWTSGTLMAFGALSLVAVSLATSDVVVTPTQRLEKNAQLVRETVEEHAPERYRVLLGSADTWKLSERTLRTCVPDPTDDRNGWCVLVRSEDERLTVVSYGEGLSNAAQALEWHPELAQEN